MIPIKTVVDKANTKISAGGLTDLEYTQLSSADVSLDRATAKVVSVASLLPSAASNEGIIYYVTNESQYYFSDGTIWRKDFTSDYELQNIPTYSWGNNNYGQLGSNSTTSRSSPGTVVSITNWSRVFAGGDFNLGLTNTGVAYAWGRNSSGQLGDGTGIGRSSPVTIVGGIANWSQLAAGSIHSLGLTTSGIVYAWGYNYGRLGDGTTTVRSSPVTVIGGITNWSQVSAGTDHSLGLRANGVLYAWGNNTSGQLGNNIGGAGTQVSSPVTVVGGITTWTQLDAANGFNVNLISTGVVYSWGSNSGGRLGDNTIVAKSSPVTVVGGITNWSQLSAEGTASHTLGVTSASVAYAWGTNSYGRLGDNTTSNRSSPVTVVGGITNWSQLSAGGDHSLGLTLSGIAYAWGNADFGKLGDNTAISKSSPVTVVGNFTNWSRVSAGGRHSIGIVVQAIVTKGFI